MGREGSKKCVCASRIAGGGAALAPPAPPSGEPALPAEPALPVDPALPDELAAAPALPVEPALAEPAFPGAPATLAAPPWPAAPSAAGALPEGEQPRSAASQVVAEAAMNFRRENKPNLPLVVMSGRDATARSQIAGPNDFEKR